MKKKIKDIITYCSITYDDSIKKKGKYKISDNKYIINTIIPSNVKSIKLVISDIPCVKYRKFKTDINYKDIKIYNSISFDNDEIFYSDDGYILLEGNFKKNQKLNFSIEIEKLNEVELYKFIEFLCVEKKINDCDVSEKEKVIEKLNDKVLKLNKEIDDIKNNKTYKFISKFKIRKK